MLKVLASLGIAVAAGLLSATTIAHELTTDEHYHITIGIATGLLSFVLLLLAFFIHVPETTMGPVLGLGLVVGGFMLVCISLALQFYIAYRSATMHSDATQHLARLVEQRISFNLNIQAWKPPSSVVALGLCVLFTGVCLLIAGVRLTLSRNVFWSELPWKKSPTAAAGPLEVLPVREGVQHRDA